MKRWSEGRRLILVIVLGLAVSLGALAAYRAWSGHQGPLAGEWRVTTVDGPGLRNVDVRTTGGSLRVTDGDAQFKDDINTYRATFDEVKPGTVTVSNASASLVGRAGPETTNQKAMGLVTHTLFNPATFTYSLDGDRATVTRNRVTLHLKRV